MDQMRLATARRPMERQGSGWPIGPPVYPADRRGVAGRDAEIGATPGYAPGQVEGELHRYAGIRSGPETETGARPIGLTEPAPSGRGSAPTERDRSIRKRLWSRLPQCLAQGPSGRL